jgi:hypothetical protein
MVHPATLIARFGFRERPKFLALCDQEGRLLSILVQICTNSAAEKFRKFSARSGEGVSS